ncbi:MAG: hypothetical protein JXB17_06655 [Bacteroidales bacterium]|nr:hypothetical protein [Bacteroidales bacterium]
MRRLFVFGLIAVVFLAWSCKKETEISANLSWEDVDGIVLSDDWKASLYEGALSFASDDDYSVAALETKDVNVDDESVIFTVTISSYENYSLVVFNDEDGDGKYTKGELADADFGGTDAGEILTFNLELSY